MKELAKIFSRRYSAVSTKEENCVNFAQNLSQHRKSLNATRNFPGGKAILNSFFNKRKKGHQTRSPKCSFLLIVCGLFAITVGILVNIFEPYELIFRWKLIFAEGGEIFGLWEKPPVDLYCKIWLFNITNAEEFLAGKDDRMRVEEVGPYVYKEIFEHHEVEFNDNNTLSTKPKHPLVWQEEMSEGRKEDDVLMMVNIALLSIAQVGADKSYFFRLPINVLIRQTNSQPIVKMTAKEFMFGYETPLTTLGNTFLPSWISFDKVGLIDRMYDFNVDFETFYTGADDPAKAGLYDTYMGSKNLPQWNGDHCSNIDMASDGTKFKSYLTPNESVKFFRKSMCRPQRMIPTGEEYMVDDFNAYKYVFEENALDNGYYREENKCYCRNGYCQPRGLIDVTDCYYGFPISLSYPHFMDSDQKLLEDINGLTPNRSKHESYFMVQPRSGLPLACSVKLQINMHMRNVRSMANVGKKFSDITIPMLWFEITMFKLPDNLKSRFTLYINVLPYVDIIGFWGGLGIGVICLVYAVIRSTTSLKLLSVQQDGTQTYDRRNTKYSKIDLRWKVYNPCEMKVTEVNEKIRELQNMQPAMYDIDINPKTDGCVGGGDYILEQEPAISDCDDNGNESDSNSTTSTNQHLCECSSIDDNNSEQQNNEENTVDNKSNCTDNGSYTNSGFDSNNKNYTVGGENNVNWTLGEASSLIDDIGNEHFSSVQVSVEEKIINKNNLL